ncbi:MAG: RNA polymerase factor sigma-54 [Bacteroidaceae bacterium]|nr:RNA polymerase factor sigma-54 [Bacteroidaceae bacterium]
MAKNSLTQTQAQTQVQTMSLSPQQVMAARLLELTTIEFEDKVRSELMDNPALEAIEPETSSIDGTIDGNDENFSSSPISSNDDYRNEDDIPDYNGWEYHASGELPEEIPLSADTSFGDILLEQLGELSLNNDERTIGEYLIGSLENDGLLHKPLSEIEDELTIYHDIHVDEKKITEILQMIQTFDPAGIGARSLQECLLLQIRREKEEASEQTSTLETAERILRQYYEEFRKKRWDILPEKSGINEEECRAAIEYITRLNPRPGAALAESLNQSRQQIIPDFTIDTQGDTLSIQLNNMYIPELRVSNEYRRMLDEQINSNDPKYKATALFLKQKIEGAKNFINAVKQREQTLTATMKAIANIQHDFLMNGGDESLLKPMILDDIAKSTGYDISTISRVSSSKYVQLPWGIYPLKYFFSDGVTTDDGNERSVRELHRCLRELVENEDKTTPLTDTELVEQLKEQGFTLARRTVAKYREQLHIPVARLRKE